MFETLARLYDGGAIQKCHLENAVDRGWITQSEKEEIIAAAEKTRPIDRACFFQEKRALAAPIQTDLFIQEERPAEFIFWTNFSISCLFWKDASLCMMVS